ncbi:MAG: chemotaxis protein CheW [Lachnospiraceae bacterium]|jgi:purine-binding chemotaxis protein CheW|nr:chemotaxis protein CheW [Lachnospiraceae bacterium]
MSEELNTQVTQLEDNINDDPKNLQRCLTFESGDLIMYMSTDYVTEIITDQYITTLPLVPDYVKGIINLRGSVLAVVDIRLLMGLDATEYTSKTCIIILNIDNVPIGIVVDNVRQVVDIDLDTVKPIPMKRQKKLLNGMLNMDDGTVAMSFDCDALINASI